MFFLACANAQIDNPSVASGEDASILSAEETARLAFSERKKNLQQAIELGRAEVITRLNVDKANYRLLDDELSSAEDQIDDKTLEQLEADLEELRFNIEYREQQISNLKKLNKELRKTKYDTQADLNLTNVKNRLNQITAKPVQKSSEAELQRPDISTKEKYDFEIDVRDVMSNPRAESCKTIITENKASDSKPRVDTDRQFLFDYTHEKLAAYFKDDAFLKADVQLSEVGGYTFLTLYIDIKSKKAKESYGEIENGSMLRLLLINGDKLYLKNVSPSSGELQAYSGITKYESIYAIDQDQIRDLKKYEIDKIGVIWSSGFEEYEVYQVDRLQQMLECLKS